MQHIHENLIAPFRKQMKASNHMNFEQPEGVSTKQQQVTGIEPVCCWILCVYNTNTPLNTLPLKHVSLLVHLWDENHAAVNLRNTTNMNQQVHEPPTNRKGHKAASPA
jgi:hypothetical protein